MAEHRVAGGEDLDRVQVLVKSQVLVQQSSFVHHSRLMGTRHFSLQAYFCVEISGKDLSSRCKKSSWNWM